MPKYADLPIRTVEASAPTRICDNGGWTDTWFSSHGRIFNIAIEPRVNVTVRCFDRASRDIRVLLNVVNFAERYAWYGLGRNIYGRHPLLEAAINYVGIPDNISVEIDIFSEAPYGASMGTSAAVTVALLGALVALQPKPLTVHELAYAAHAVETEHLGLQSGIQDQLAAAYGGINYIEIEAYPHAVVEPIRLSKVLESELEQRLSLVYLGKPHQSSSVHEMVVHDLEKAGTEGEKVSRLRQTAGPSRDALLAGDFVLLGEMMKRNTEAQRALHPLLISPAAQQVIDLARSLGALGWKVNGAGGDGGSVTLLGEAQKESKEALVSSLLALNRAWQVIPIRLSPCGITVR